jgi:hypothetical protein
MNRSLKRKPPGVRIGLAAKIVVFVALACAGSARGASPSVDALRPHGGQRGTEVKLILGGARLSDARAILFYQPGITATSVRAISDRSVETMLRIDADCPPGLHEFRLVTASGLSEVRSFSVGLFREIGEVEPNNEFAAPQAIAMNSTVNGVSESEDVDHFVVSARKGERISVEVEGIRLGHTEYYDPFIAILDEHKFALATCDDTSFAGLDGFASIIAPEDGNYVIQVRDTVYAGHYACVYRLHVGGFPRPLAAVPGGGKLGEELEVTWVGDLTGRKTTKWKLPASPVDNYGVVASFGETIAPHPNVFRLAPFGNVIEIEPNDRPQTAREFRPPMALNGVIRHAGDVDHYVFRATKGEVYDLNVYARALGSPLDAVLGVGPRSGGTSAVNDDSGGPDSAVRFRVPADGEYDLWIQDRLLKGGEGYAYRIEATSAAPRLALSLPSELTVPHIGTVAVAVPKGGRQAILLNVNRRDFRGEAVIEAGGLPDGVSLEADRLIDGIGTHLLVFRAEARAKSGGSLVSLVGKAVDPTTNLASEFAQSTEVLMTPGNRISWSRKVGKLALAVTEEAPFSIAIVEPKVPLVRDGLMELKVVATRKPGFTAPIAVSLPWNPPGVASSGRVSIAANETVALIPLNASGSAELRTWKIVVNGTSTVATGPLTVSSALANLTVGAPLVALSYQPFSIEQGEELEMPMKVETRAGYLGAARATLVGLPNRVTAAPVTITADSTELVFHVRADKAAPAGNHTGVYVRLVVTRDGEPIVHNLGPAQLRIDAPIVSKPKASGAGNTPQAQKPASRLEALRREAKRRNQKNP